MKVVAAWRGVALDEAVARAEGDREIYAVVAHPADHLGAAAVAAENGGQIECAARRCWARRCAG